MQRRAGGPRSNCRPSSVDVGAIRSDTRFPRSTVPATNLAATDSHGWPAYLCASDLGTLEPVADTPSVLACRTCGHRTDEPGQGLLDDGFDVIHRQWGLRGDPHLWDGVRGLVGSTPTPIDRDRIREVFVDAIMRVADVDVDRTEELRPYREHLDHGGMHGGFIDVGWWLTKGLPLLVERASTRRPVDPAPVVPAGRNSRFTGLLVWLVVMSIPAALIGGGVFLLYQRAWGTAVEATVLSCDTTGGVFAGAATYGTECVAEWEIDGRVVVGGFTGGNGAADVGRTVDATVRGDVAYSGSLVLPIVLLALGLPFLAIPVLATRSRRRRQEAPSQSG